MRLRLLNVCLAGFLLLPGTLCADFAGAKAEPNLEKRSKLLLENADEALESARGAYSKGDLKQVKDRLEEVRKSVELAWQSLEETGKNPRRHPKWFKRAEIATRRLLRKMSSFEEEMSFTDRSLLQPAQKSVNKVHDDLLLGIMEGKRK